MKVPDVGEGIADVEIVAWRVALGDEVARNQILVEVVTDKANVELPAPVAGTLTRRHGEPGDRLEVGAILAEFAVASAVDHRSETQAWPPPATSGRRDPRPADNGWRSPNHALPEDDEELPAPLSLPVPPTPAPSLPPVSDPPSSSLQSDQSTQWDQADSDQPSHRPKATPVLRHRTRIGGVDLDQVVTSSPNGRSADDDIERHQTSRDRSAATPDTPADEGAVGPLTTPSLNLVATPTVEPKSLPTPEFGIEEPQPLIDLRRQVAQQMVTSVSATPNITYVEEVDVTELEGLRQSLNADHDATHLTVLPFLVQALVKAVAEHPKLNAHLEDDETLRVFSSVNVGIATQTDRGLLVPVVHQAENLGFAELAEHIAAVTDAARNGSAELSSLRGSTITISSMGPLGGIISTPIVNKPEVAIVGVNRIAVRPSWDGHRFIPRQIMNLSLSFDHRVIDGWDAAQFVHSMKRYLEQPARLFLDW